MSILEASRFFMYSNERMVTTPYLVILTAYPTPWEEVSFVWGGWGVWGCVCVCVCAKKTTKDSVTIPI